MDNTQFSAGSFANAERRATGEFMTAAERMLWSRRMTKVALGYGPDEEIPLDRTAFSMRKRDK
ncbi:MAG: hypothetical protein WCR04_09590 [Fibrobacteraceae bacterium]